MYRIARMIATVIMSPAIVFIGAALAAVLFILEVYKE